MAARSKAGTGASTGADTVATERVEIATRGERRRSYTLDEKARLLAKTAEGRAGRAGAGGGAAAQRFAEPTAPLAARRGGPSASKGGTAGAEARAAAGRCACRGDGAGHNGGGERRDGRDHRGGPAQRPRAAGRRGGGRVGGRAARRGARGVIALPAGARILLATRPIDFRKGAPGLAALAAEALGQDPFSGVAIVFRSKRADRIKILVWDASGLVLVWKKLEGRRVPLAADRGRRDAADARRVRGAVRRARLDARRRAETDSQARGRLLDSRRDARRRCRHRQPLEGVGLGIDPRHRAALPRRGRRRPLDRGPRPWAEPVRQAAARARKHGGRGGGPGEGGGRATGLVRALSADLRSAGPRRFVEMSGSRILRHPWAMPSQVSDERSPRTLSRFVCRSVRRGRGGRSTGQARIAPDRGEWTRGTAPRIQSAAT